MSNNLKLDESIKNTLRDGPLTGKQIKKVLFDDENVKYPVNEKESFDEAFCRLLLADEIYIFGFQPPEDVRIQNIKSDYLLFSQIKTEPIYIQDLLRKTDDQDLKIAEKALYDIKKLFENKLKEIETLNLRVWESLKKDITIRDLRTEDIIFMEGESESDSLFIAIDYFIENNDFFIDELVHDDKSISIRVQRYKNQLEKLKQKYQDYKAVILTHPNYKRENLDSIEKYINIKIDRDEMLNYISFIDKEKDYEDIYYHKKIYKESQIDLNEYLEAIGLKMPKNRSYNKIEMLFYDIYYSSQPKIFEKLPIALSDQENSNIILDEIVYEITGKHLVLNKSVI